MSTAGVPGNAIRRIFESDLSHLRSHLTRLGPSGLRARFGYHVSDRFLDAYAERCVSANAILYGYFENGTMRGVGEMHFTADDAEQDHPDGELAFSIELRWRRCGIGTQLIQHLLAAARQQRVERLMVQCVVGNTAMLSLVRRYATELTLEQDLVTGYVPIGRASACRCDAAENGFPRARPTPEDRVVLAA